MSEHFLTTYVRRLADEMGLGNWKINVTSGTPENPEPFAFAETTVWGERFQGDILLNRDWHPTSKEELREILVHELLHLHLTDLDHAFYATETLLGKPTYAVAVDRYRTDREKAVQQIARFWAPHLPLPPKVKE